MLNTKTSNPLRRYLDRHGLTLEAFADRIGSYPANVRRYALPLDHVEFTVPSPRTMRAIVSAANGEIDPGQFYAAPPSRP